MSDWLEHSVQVEVEVPVELAWNLWSDLEQMPRWMKWIESVTILEENPELSYWGFGVQLAFAYAESCAPADYSMGIG
jgi:uncharacterized membrane protein